MCSCFFINKWTGLLAILFGINCVKSDEEEGLLGQLISLPILRGEYLIGRIFGASIIVFFFLPLVTSNDFIRLREILGA